MAPSVAQDELSWRNIFLANSGECGAINDELPDLDWKWLFFLPEEPESRLPWRKKAEAFAAIRRNILGMEKPLIVFSLKFQKKGYQMTQLFPY